MPFQSKLSGTIVPTMRDLLRLVEADEPSTAPIAPADEPAKPESAVTKAYYHVTTTRRLKSIKQKGIEPGHNRRWRTQFGVKLGQRGNIYLMSDFSSAIRWACKQEWEEYQGKPPVPSPYVIVCVRENPKNVEPDPHPENGLYGNSWFMKTGSIPPEDITHIIPLTLELRKQVVNMKQATPPVMEGSLTGLRSLYSLSKCEKALADKGWRETDTDYMYRNPEYPEYSVDLDINNPQGGPFTIFRGNRKLKVTRSLPFAQQLGLKDRLTDVPREPDAEPELLLGGMG